MIAPASHNSNSLEPANFLLRAPAIVRRHWKRSALFFCVTMMLIVAGIFLSPKTYQSEAKLFVRMGRESVTLDPTATTGQVVSVYESRENEINSVLEVIQSRVILERVVDRLGAKTILSGRLPTEPHMAANSADVKPAQSTAPDRQREQAIQLLERLVSVSHAKKSSVINVIAKGSSPELAQRIVQIVLDEFRVVHLRVNRTAGSLKFFGQQKELVKKQLEEHSNAFEAAKNQLGLTTLEAQRKTLQELIHANLTSSQANAAELAGIDATIASLQKSIDEMPATMVAQRVVGQPNSAEDRIRQQRNQLQIRLRQLLTKYTEHFPEVIAIREQLAGIETILNQQEPGNTQSTTATNPTAQQLQIRLLTETARAKSLKSKESELSQQKADLLTRLKTLNSNEGRITRMKSEVERLQVAFKNYSEKYEQARIDGALSAEHISNVNVVQPPTFVNKPVGPKKRLIGLLGLVIASIGSIGVAYLSEFVANRKDHDVDEDPSFNTPPRQSKALLATR